MLFPVKNESTVQKDCYRRIYEMKNTRKIEGGAAIAYEDMTSYLSNKGEWILDLDVY